MYNVNVQMSTTNNFKKGNLQEIPAVKFKYLS